MDQQFSGTETALDQTSAEFVGRWNRLVSTTNWEKGRIICQWRERLEADAAPPASSTDEAWSRCVGNVSPQHVGRLRRVFQRFGGVADQYPSLYWSHFQAALDWDDAEMWLEGAVQSGWSVAQMRSQRYEATGAAAQAELDEEIPAAEFDEDSEPPQDPFSGEISGSPSQVYDPETAGEPARGDAPSEPSARDDDPESSPRDPDREPPPAPVRPFEKLPSLPADLAEAFEQFKLALLRHKLAGWQEVPRDHVLAALEALKQLVSAP